MAGTLWTAVNILRALRAELIGLRSQPYLLMMGSLDMETA